jgi:hypothetical protein
VEPVNHWQPVTTEYQLELVPAVETKSSRRKRQKPRPVEIVNYEARAEAEAVGAVTAMTCYYFLRACAYFLCGSVLLCYPASGQAAWLIAHARLLLPVSLSSAGAVPVINLLAEGLFIMAGISAAVCVMWLVQSWGIRAITMFYAATSVACTALYFAAQTTIEEKVLLSVHQQEALLADAMLNLLIFAYLLFCPGVE